MVRSTTAAPFCCVRAVVARVNLFSCSHSEIVSLFKPVVFVLSIADGLITTERTTLVL